MTKKSAQSKKLVGGIIGGTLVASVDGLCPHGAICTTTPATITTQPASSSAEPSSSASSSQIVTDAASSSSSSSSQIASQASSSASASSAQPSTPATSTPQAVMSSSTSQASSEAATSSSVPATSPVSSSVTFSSSASSAASQASSSLAVTSSPQPSSTPVTSTPQLAASSPTSSSSAPITSASATAASTSASNPTSNTPASTPSNPTASVQQTTAKTTPLTSSQTPEPSTDSSSSSSSSYSSILTTVKEAMTSGTVSSIAGSIGTSFATTVSGYITGSSSSSSANFIDTTSTSLGFHNATTTAPHGGSSSNSDVNLIAILIGVIGGTIVLCLCIATRRRCLENVNKRAGERAERRMLNARLHDAPILPMENLNMQGEMHALKAVVIVGNKSGSEIVFYDNVLDTTSPKNSKATPEQNQSNEPEYREYLKPVPLKNQKVILTIDTVSFSSSDPDSSGHGPSSEDEEDATAAVDTAATHDDWDEAVYTLQLSSRKKPKAQPKVNVNASLVYIDGVPQYEQPVRLDHYQMDALDPTRNGVNWPPADYAIQPSSPRYETVRGDQYQRTYDNVLATNILTPPLQKKLRVSASSSPEHFGFFGDIHVYESASDPVGPFFDNK